MAALSRQDRLDLSLTDTNEPTRRISTPFYNPFAQNGTDGGASHYDQADMQRMNKPQQFRRRFEITSVVGFTSCIMGTWEILLTTSGRSLANGGLAGMFWSLVWTTIGQFFVVLSLAELASSAPTAGALYHWVSECAPPQWQKFLSYFAGWLSVIAWQTFLVIDGAIISMVIQSLMQLQDPTYASPKWQGTLFMIAAILAVAGFNIVLAQHLPNCEGLFATFHFFVFVPIVVGLFILSPGRSAYDVFANFTVDQGGWGNSGLSVLVGQVSNMFVVLGSDGVAHLAEEIEDAGVNLPQGMVWSYIINAPLSLLMVLAYLFSINSVPDALKAPMPFVTAFKSAFNPINATIAFTLVVLGSVSVVAASALASTSRIVFAFARDRGLPYSQWLSTVDRRFNVPANAILLTATFAICTSLINLGSTVAFEGGSTTIMSPEHAC